MRLIILVFLFLACTDPVSTATESVTDTLYISTSDTIVNNDTITTIDTVYFETPADDFTGVKTRIVLDKWGNTETTFYDTYENGFLVDTEKWNHQNILIQHITYSLSGDTLISQVFE